MRQEVDQVFDPVEAIFGHNEERVEKFRRGTFEDKILLLMDDSNLKDESDTEIAAELNRTYELRGLLGMPKLGAHHIELVRTGDIARPDKDKHGNTITREWRDDGEMTMTITDPSGKVEVIESRMIIREREEAEESDGK